MQDIDSSWQCLMLPCRENKMHAKSNWIIIVQQVRKTGYSKWGGKQHAEGGKKSQNRQEKNETDSKSPLLYMYFIWYICITFVSLCWAYFYANIMDNGLFLLCFFMMFFQPICQLLLSGCFIHVSSMIVCSCVDCSDPKLLYADIIPSGTCNVYMAWSWVGFLNMSYN